MKAKQKNRKLQIWLDSDEYSFLQEYSIKNHLNVSELVRGWIHEVMKREGYEIKEPSLPIKTPKKRGK